MAFIKTDFPGLMVYEPNVFQDSRGYFFETFNAKVFKDAGIDVQFVQDNQSRSAYGVIRGLHYQLEPHAQSKLIRVMKGSIQDIVVDIRKGSPTFGKVYSTELSAENFKQLFIPKGFAHGFSVLSEYAEVIYKCDVFYNKESESGISYKDPALEIDWKIPAGEEIISEKDQHHPTLENCVNNFNFD